MYIMYRAACQKIKRSGFEKHHWSYNKDHYKDVIFLRPSDHAKAHRFLKYDQSAKMYRNNDGVLLEIKYKNCRFDAVVFKNDKPIAIVEVKNYSIKTSTRGLKKTSRQWIKYNSFGLPVIELLNSKMIFNAFDEVVRIYNLNQNTSC